MENKITLENVTNIVDSANWIRRYYGQGQFSGVYETQGEKFTLDIKPTGFLYSGGFSQKYHNVQLDIWKNLNPYTKPDDIRFKENYLYLASIKGQDLVPLYDKVKATVIEAEKSTMERIQQNRIDSLQKLKLEI